VLFVCMSGAGEGEAQILCVARIIAHLFTDSHAHNAGLLILPHLVNTLSLPHDLPPDLFKCSNHKFPHAVCNLQGSMGGACDIISIADNPLKRPRHPLNSTAQLTRTPVDTTKSSAVSCCSIIHIIST